MSLKSKITNVESMSYQSQLKCIIMLLSTVKVVVIMISIAEVKLFSVNIFRAARDCMSDVIKYNGNLV